MQVARRRQLGLLGALNTSFSSVAASHFAGQLITHRVWGPPLCCWCSVGRGPLTVQATPPLHPPAPSAAFSQAQIVRRLQAAGPIACTSPVPSEPALHRQPTDFGAQFPSSLRAAAPLSTLVSTNSLSLASLSLQICGAPVFNPPLLARSLAGWLVLSLSIRLSLFSWATARTATRA